MRVRIICKAPPQPSEKGIRIEPSYADTRVLLVAADGTETDIGSQVEAITWWAPLPTATPPVSEWHRALLAFAGRRSAAELAPILDAPERTVRRWLAGARPVWARRPHLERLLGLSWRDWYPFKAAS